MLQYLPQLHDTVLPTSESEQGVTDSPGSSDYNQRVSDLSVFSLGEYLQYKSVVFKLRVRHNLLEDLLKHKLLGISFRTCDVVGLGWRSRLLIF